MTMTLDVKLGDEFTISLQENRILPFAGPADGVQSIVLNGISDESIVVCRSCHQTEDVSDVTVDGPIYDSTAPLTLVWTFSAVAIGTAQVNFTGTTADGFTDPVYQVTVS